MTGSVTENDTDADAPQADRQPSLWRNRDFNLLWSGQCLSDLGSAVSDLALPLLVFGLTGSPSRAGLVGTAGLVVATVCRLPAGALADRFDRRRLMILCDAVRLVGYAALAWAVVAGRASLAVIMTVVAVSAAATAVFTTTEFAAVRSLVRPNQIVSAVARNEARSYGTTLAGRPLGGLLFGLGTALPFLGDAVSYVLSLSAILCIRRPLQQPRPELPATPAKTGRRGQGLRFVLSNPFLRSLIVVAIPLNTAFTGMIFAMTISLRRSGLSPVLIGVATMIIGAGGLLGAFSAPALQRRLPLPTLIRAICWSTAALMAISVLLATGIAAAAPLALAIFLGPTANAALFGYQAAVTPDHLQGRVVSVILLAATSAAALAPALAGFLLANIAGRPALLTFPLLVAVSAAVATFSGGIKSMARLPSDSDAG
ncbi:MFS transporter [Catenulispora sp. NF23]|uniref:MFS transporter n=1 Tax=Catenulispora pinistramenti TaxID=2705254 RepID=A0ABS5KG73_9ACTN|nr:MFS transporter [Catenulispora pinistramenti]MBS2537004.1 MFS transporter [Catenulispora pinistramenti]MBS2545251.1 MFS transporter [Catenulispora pinistramenti]